MFMTSGNENRLRTCEGRHAVEHAHADGASVACESVWRAHRQLTVSTLKRYIALSASERRWQPLPFFHSQRPWLAIASLRHVAPGVFAGH